MLLLICLALRNSSQDLGFTFEGGEVQKNVGLKQKGAIIATLQPIPPGIPKRKPLDS